MCQSLQAIVVGAGIGGLAFAILARKQGLRVTVLEKTEELTPVLRLLFLRHAHLSKADWSHSLGRGWHSDPAECFTHLGAMRYPRETEEVLRGVRGNSIEALEGWRAAVHTHRGRSSG